MTVTATRVQRTIPCEYRERLFRYLSRTVKALIAEQEEAYISPTTARFWRPRYAASLIAAAYEWKQTRLNYEQDVRDHGYPCSRCAEEPNDLNGLKKPAHDPRVQ